MLKRPAASSRQAGARAARESPCTIISTRHVYPTMSEANKYAAGVWKRAHAPATALRWAERFFAWRR